jgi:general nucleoside transport system permease protein
MTARSAAGASPRSRGAASVAAVKWIGWIAVAFALYAAVLLAFRHDPIAAYRDIFLNTIASPYGMSEVLVKLIPLALTALAVTIPGRVGLVNVGGEGQLFMGAAAATLVALTTPGLPAIVLLPLMSLAGFAGGALWALLPALLRAKGWLNEVFSTLLLNYLAVLTVQALVFGPWRDPASYNYPESAVFAPTAWLPALGDTRLHVGIVIALVLCVVLWYTLGSTRWGLEMRAIGANPESARRNGIPVVGYVIVAMAVGGGIAGLAGMAEASAIHHRLSPGISAGLGYMGFLVSWLAGHRPLLIPPMAFLIATLAVGGDLLQITQGVPYGALNILMALILFVVLAGRAGTDAAR